jgi:N-acetylneuraminic acid mutarotase
MMGLLGTRPRVGALIMAATAALALAAPAVAGTPNTWSETGAMATGRGGPAAALLANGNVLEAGGTTAGGTSDKTAEIYNTSAGTFSAAAPMGVGRVAPTAVVLQSGSVLVLGGSDTGADQTAEVYNPAANTWTPTANNMTIPGGEFPSAALLPDGRVLVVGGNDGPATTAADIYNPSTNSFTAAAPMGTARSIPAMITLPSGKVLVAGGLDASGNALASAEVYDPSANSWTPVSNSMSSPHVAAQISALPGGKVLVAGGLSELTPTATTTASAEIYDPATNSFTAAASMSNSRYFFGLTALSDGRVLAAGGLTVSGTTPTVLSSAELYNPTSNTWTATGSLNEARAAQGQTLLGNGQVLAAGGISGIGGSGGLASAELYTPSTVPGAPQAVSAVPGNAQATISWAPPASDGGSAIQHYTVKASTGQTVSTPDGRTTATVAGLTNGRAVTFTVTATTAVGTGVASAASNSVTPAGSPHVAISGVKSKLKRKSFLKGLKVKLAPNEPVSLQVSLVASAKKATIARAFNLTLATHTLGLAGSSRTVKLKPNKTLVGKAKKFKVRILVVATDSLGNRVTETKTLSVKG